MRFLIYCLAIRQLCSVLKQGKKTVKKSQQICQNIVQRNEEEIQEMICCTRGAPLYTPVSTSVPMQGGHSEGLLSRNGVVTASCITNAMLCSSIITQFKSYVNAGYNKSNQKIDSSIITKRPMVDSSLLSLFDFFRLF